MYVFDLQSRLCDTKRRKGLIYNRIVYHKYKKPSKKCPNVITVENEPSENAIENNTDDAVDELTYLLYFKTCLVDRDLEILKIKLAQTVEMREVLIKKKDTQFHKMFPFYFIEPSLVSVFVHLPLSFFLTLSFPFFFLLVLTHTLSVLLLSHFHFLFLSLFPLKLYLDFVRL